VTAPVLAVFQPGRRRQNRGKRRALPVKSEAVHGAASFQLCDLTPQCSHHGIYPRPLGRGTPGGTHRTAARPALRTGSGAIRRS
jgi:hypothetical protein